MVRGSLETVRLKLGRAEKHLDEITGMLSLLKKGQCRIVTEHNQDRNLLIHRISITPKPPPALSVVIGDFLFAVRSALDHLLWQLVVVNGNFPCTKNMFPITSTPENFTEAAGNRKRLKGVSTEVYALIEGLQPYHRGNEALERLDTLHNVDKHRTLNMTTVVADNTSLRYYRAGNPVVDTFLGAEELRDGAVFGGFGIPLNNPELITMFPHIYQTMSEMEVKGEASLFVAFDEAGVDYLEVFRIDLTLANILQFVQKDVIPSFEPLFG